MSMLKNEIGCSIPLDYLAGLPDTEFEALFGAPEECLKLFKSKGVEAIELRSVSTRTPVGDIPKAVERVLDAELSLTIHASLPDFTANDPLAIFALMPDIDMILTIHAYAGSSNSERWHAEKTVEGFRALLDGTPPNFIFALEVNRARAGRIDPGNSYQGVLEMLEEIDSPRVGACWDLGHSESNVRNGYSSRIPTKDFINRVAHTHIHGLSENGRTHFPLTGENLPLPAYLAPLLESGYSGILNFEPGVDRWTDAVENKREAFLTSIDILRAVRETLASS